ncbi:MAG: hypothetical protein V4573_02040 [Pseudomonadota bacterium]
MKGVAWTAWEGADQQDITLHRRSAGPIPQAIDPHQVFACAASLSWHIQGKDPA